MSRLKYACFFLIMKFTGWLPDFVPVLLLRGLLVRPLLKSCGRNLRITSGVTILSPDRVEMGDDVWFGLGVWLQGRGGVKLGDGVMLGPYTILASSNHTKQDGGYRFGSPETAPIEIGAGSWTGSHVTITSGVTLGKGVACAANCVVTKDFGDHVIVGGNPGTVIRSNVDNS